MRSTDWLQLVLFVAALAAITRPMGLYLVRVLDANGRTWLDPILKPFERLTYRLMGVKADREQDWKRYTFAMLLFSLVSCLFTYGILRLQHLLPLNPQGFGALSPDLAFNTAVSFTTNTNWQSYTGESTMSYLSQMVALVIHNFASAATGIAIAAALVRGIARHSAKTLGNFWVDLVRTTYYLLLPICLVFAVFLVSQGMIQNFKPYTKAKLLEPMKLSVEKKNDKGETIKGPDGKPVMEEQTVTEQLIVQGPMASQVAIKMLGTNGGGYTNANAAHPFENPTPALQLHPDAFHLRHRQRADLLPRAHGQEPGARLVGLGGDDGFVPGRRACCAGGRKRRQSDPSATRGRRGRRQHGRQGSPLRHLQLRPVRHRHHRCLLRRGQSMHDSFTALGGFVPLFNIQLGEIIIGGVGAGLYGMLVFVVLAVFIAGLMVGRTPEYLGKKIQSYEVKMAMLALLVLARLHPGLCRLGVGQQMGPGRIEQHRPARAERNPLRLQFRQRQQRQRFCRPERQHALVQHDPWPGHVDRPLPDDRADHGHGRLARRKRRSPRPAPARSRSRESPSSCCCWARCCWSAR